MLPYAHVNLAWRCEAQCMPFNHLRSPTNRGPSPHRTHSSHVLHQGFVTSRSGVPLQHNTSLQDSAQRKQGKDCIHC